MSNMVEGKRSTVFCGSNECMHNRDGECIWLNKHGNSTIGKGEDKKIVMCAWYNRGQKYKCENCRYSVARIGKKLLMCEKTNQLIPPGRYGCERYRE